MAKDLVIVESPTKARTLTRLLGGSYEVKASVGHIRDLPEKRLGIDLANQFEPEYVTDPAKKNVVAELRKLAKAADHIYLATDPDREGEAIAWHLYEVLGGQRVAPRTHRVTFHEITQSAVQQAFQSPGRIEMNRVEAQQARRVLDRLVGYQVSPLLWKRIDQATSAGRVQSVALRLICEREAAIENFTPEEYWLLTATFASIPEAAKFPARLARVDGDKAEVKDARQAESLAADAEKGQYLVSKVAKTPRTRRPAPPFVTSTLQQAASSNLRMTPEQTMRVAQQLYEGVDTGKGPTGLITYMRTDSVNVAKEAQQAARTFIEQQFGAQFVPSKPNVYKSRSGAQEAHEAIRPTDVALTPKQAAQYLDERQSKLYRLIWNRFIASQMAPAKLMLHTVEIENTGGTDAKGPTPGCEHLLTFRAASTSVQFPGFLQVYNLHDVEGEDEEETGTLPPLRERQGCNLDSLDKDQKFTEPPKRFTESALVRELESNGVGRPSTYASIIGVIKSRKYVHVQKRALLPTDLGKQVNEYLVQAMPSLFDVGFTARMENQLDEVEEGQVDWHQMLAQFYDRFQDWLEEARTAGNVQGDRVHRVLALFPAGFEFDPARKVGRRTYDDRKFVADMAKQAENGGDLTERQWSFLLKLVARYEDRLQGVDDAIAAAGAREEYEELRRQAREAAERAARGPDTVELQLCRSLANVQNWQKNKRGNKVYDDREFFSSIAKQVEEGRKLTDNQRNALGKLAVKYREELPDFAELKESLGLDEPEALPLANEQIATLIAYLEKVEEWDPPTPSKRGKPFDEKEFVQSISEQFKQRKTLSPRQFAALVRAAKKYQDRVPGFAEATRGMNLEALGTRGGRGGGGSSRAKAEPTGVKCPACNEGEMVKRSGRGRPFFGCSRYPKCKHTMRELPDQGS